LLRLQLTGQVLKLLNCSLVLQILQVSTELENVDTFIELGNSLFFGLKLVDVESLVSEEDLLRLVSGGLRSFH